MKAVAPATFRLRKIHNPFAELQYSVDHFFTIRFRASVLHGDVIAYNGNIL